MSETKRAVIYARSATVQDNGSLFAKAEQIHRCKEYAAKEGYEVVEEFQETGSGMTIDRPVLKSVLEAAKEGRFDALLINTFDRLSRDVVKAAHIIEKLKGYGVNVFIISNPVLPNEIDTTMQMMIAVFREEVAKIERERISARSRAGRQQKGK